MSSVLFNGVVLKDKSRETWAKSKRKEEITQQYSGGEIKG